MSPKELDVIASLVVAATAGPWTPRKFDEHQTMVLGDSLGGGGRPRLIASVAVGEGGSNANAEFVAAARTAVPELLAEVRRLQSYVRGRTREAERATSVQRDALLAEVAAMVRTKADAAIRAAEDSGGECYAGKAAGATELLEDLRRMLG